MSEGLRFRAARPRRSFASSLLVASLALGACTSVAPDPEPGPAPLLGDTTQAEILASNPRWVDELVRSQADAGGGERLTRPAAGREVVVYLGTWCSDSRRELTRLWSAVEMAGGDFGFPVRYVGVDRTKTEPAALLEGVDLRYVPTLIVFDGGTEVGRIVETAPHAIESDLADLIEGAASGWLSGRDDLDPPRAPESRP